jgi:hypothetical protein
MMKLGLDQKNAAAAVKSCTSLGNVGDSLKALSKPTIFIIQPIFKRKTDSTTQQKSKRVYVCGGGLRTQFVIHAGFLTSGVSPCQYFSLRPIWSSHLNI